MNLLEKDERDSYVYDPQIKGLDSNFWATLGGTTITATGTPQILRFNAATGASFLLHEFFFAADFKLNIPAKPTTGDSRRWGFFSPAGSADFGGIYFDITGTAFTSNIVDDAGNSVSKALTWDDTNWSGKAIVFRIVWEPDEIAFWVNGAKLATFDIGASNSLPQFIALPVYIKNGNSDNVDLSYLAVKRAAGVV